MASRRNIRRRIRRRAKAVRRRVGKAGRKHKKSIITTVGSAVATIVFFSQLTAKDRESGAYSSPDMGTKVKVFTNNVTGRILGFNFFSDVQKFPQTININGAFNRFSGASLAGVIYGSLPFGFLPHKGKVKSISKKTLVASILGGIFDAPGGSSSHSIVSSPMISNGRQVSTT